MKVFVTGASGYIGTVVAAAAQAHGHQVLGLARSDSVATQLGALGIEPLLGDMRDGACLIVGAQRADAVIHCAAIRGPEMATADREAVTTLLGALARSGKPFIYTGSAFVYGDTGNRVVDEDAPLSPTAIGPWRQVIEGDILAAASGVHGVVLRVPLVYGHGGSFILPRLIERARTDGVAFYVGTGENHWSTVHVDDLADLYVRALERAPAGSVFNAAAAPAVQWRRLAQAIGHAAGVGDQVASWSVEDASRLFGPYGPGFSENQRLSAARATSVLGWDPHACSVLDDLERGSYMVRQSTGGVPHV